MLVDVLPVVKIQEGVDFLPFKKLKPVGDVMVDDLVSKFAVVSAEAPLDLTDLPAFEGIEGRVVLNALPSGLRYKVTRWNEPLGSIKEEEAAGKAALFISSQFTIQRADQYYRIFPYGVEFDLNGQARYLHCAGQIPQKNIMLMLNYRTGVKITADSMLSAKGSNVQRESLHLLPQDTEKLQAITAKITVPPFGFNFH